MQNIVPLSGGNSAELRSAAELSERQRRPVVRARAQVSPTGEAALIASNRLVVDAKEEDKEKKLSAEDRAKLEAQVQFTAADIDILNEVNDLAVVAFVKHWSFPDKPITLENVLDLASPDYDALRVAVAPLTDELFVSFAPNKDPKSPTEPSSDSATRSEGPAELSIVHQTSGEPTVSSKSA